MSNTANTKRNQGKLSWLTVAGVVTLLVILAMGWMWLNEWQKDDTQFETISREGVVTQIQQLNRLQTVAFSVDTVITSEKQGNWYNLWQDQQKGLFIAHGRVQAGVDLAKLTPEMVTVRYGNASDADVQPSPPPATQSATSTDTDANQSVTVSTSTSAVHGSDTHRVPHIDIQLPAAEIFAVYLDDIEVYDWKTGVFGMLQADPDILNQAQISGKNEVLTRACAGGVLDMATRNAQSQVQQLFALTGARVTVRVTEPAACQM